jgi:ribokinase
MKHAKLYDLLVIGDLNFDFLGTVPYYPEPDDEVEMDKFDGYLGGSGANFAVDGARLGLKSAFYSAVGKDSNAQALLDLVEQEGVSTEFIKRVDDVATGVVFGMIQSDGVRRLFCYRGANLCLYPEDIPDLMLEKVSRLHLNGPEYQIALSMLSRSRRLGIPNSMDPGMILISQHKAEIDQLLKYTDILFVNHVELTALSEGSTDQERANALLEKGVKWVVLKKGAKGSALFRKNESPLEMNAFDIKALDSTGAGDAFNAGFLHGVINGLGLSEILKQANAVGAMGAMAFGATTNVPTSIDQLNAFIQSTPLKSI